MKNKKIASLAVLGACFSMVMGLATSCGGKSSGEVYDPNKVSIDVWNTFSIPQQSIFKKISNSFTEMMKEEDGIDVVIHDIHQGNYNSLRDQISNDFSAGKAPTIAVAYPDHVAHFMHQERKPGDYIVNLEPLINDPEIGLTAEKNLNRYGIEDYVPSFLDEGKHYVNEGIYSLPFEKSTELLFYNKTAVDEILDDWKGIKDSTTFMKELKYGDFMAMLNYINDNHEKYFIGPDSKPNKKSECHALFYDSDANMFITQSYQRDIPYIDYKDGKGQILFNNDDALDMALEFRELHRKGILLTKNSNNTERASDDFKNGKCLFIVGSSGGASYNDVEGLFEVGVTKVPVYQKYNDESKTYEDIPAERQKYVSQGVTLALFHNPALTEEHNAQKIKYGWRFMKYLTNSINSIEMCLNSNGYVPARKSSYKNREYSKWLDNKKSYMAQCAKIVINDIDGQYFNYPVFAGSDKARIKVGELVDQVLRISDDAKARELAKGYFDRYENEAKLALGA